MLDKSVPYKRIIMRLAYEKNNFHKEVRLPAGYSYQMYKPGMEEAWATTETEVLEFESKEKALEYFNKELIPYKDQLKKRMVFILNPEGIPVANACAWYVDYKGIHQAHAHFVAVRPEYQGRGLGKAIFTKILTIFHEVEEGQDIYLHTQTWSHKAIQMYLRMGFEMTIDENIGYLVQNKEEAIDVLGEIFTEVTMKKLRGNPFTYRLKRLWTHIVGGK